MSHLSLGTLKLISDFAGAARFTLAGSAPPYIILAWRGCASQQVPRV